MGCLIQRIAIVATFAREKEKENLMALTNVTVNFTGLCAFVRHTVQSRLKVVLVDAINHDHLPVLLIPEVNFNVGSVRQPDFTFLAPDNVVPRVNNKRVTVHAFVLEKFDLEFLPPAPSAFAAFSGVSGCPNNTNNTNFDFITKMLTVGAGTIKNSALGANPPGVISRFLLLGTNLSTTSFRGSANGINAIGQWQFRNSGGTAVGNPRACAETCAVSFSINPPANWGIRVTQFTGGSDVIVLTANSSSQISLWVANVPLRNLLTGAFQILTPEAHFAHFYQIATTNPGHLPHFHSACPQGSGGLNGPKCPPTEFDPNALV